jgi:hypothetical protein
MTTQNPPHSLTARLERAIVVDTHRIYQLSREAEDKDKKQLGKDLMARYHSLKADYVRNMNNLVVFYEGRIKDDNK